MCYPESMLKLYTGGTRDLSDFKIELIEHVFGVYHYPCCGLPVAFQEHSGRALLHRH